MCPELLFIYIKLEVVNTRKSMNKPKEGDSNKVKILQLCTFKSLSIFLVLCMCSAFSYL